MIATQTDNYMCYCIHTQYPIVIFCNDYEIEFVPLIFGCLKYIIKE